MNAQNSLKLTGIGSMATRLVMTALASAWERKSGHEISLISIGGVDVQKRIRAGEAFDFVVLAAKVIDAQADEGHAEPQRFDIARSEMMVAVRSGMAHPAIGSEAALREAIAAGGRIGYSTGPSGDYLVGLLKGWGMTDALASRLVQAPPGIGVAQLLAENKADLGFQQMSEFVGEAGIEVIGPLPEPLRLVTTFSAAVCVKANQAEAAREFLAFAVSPEADAIKAECGMTPAR